MYVSSNRTSELVFAFSFNIGVKTTSKWIQVFESDFYVIEQSLDIKEHSILKLQGGPGILKFAWGR